MCQLKMVRSRKRRQKLKLEPLYLKEACQEKLGGLFRGYLCRLAKCKGRDLAKRGRKRKLRGMDRDRGR